MQPVPRGGTSSPSIGPVSGAWITGLRTPASTPAATNSPGPGVRWRTDRRGLVRRRKSDGARIGVVSSGDAVRVEACPLHTSQSSRAAEQQISSTAAAAAGTMERLLHALPRAYSVWHACSSSCLFNCPSPPLQNWRNWRNPARSSGTVPHQRSWPIACTILFVPCIRPPQLHQFIHPIHSPSPTSHY